MKKHDFENCCDKIIRDVDDFLHSKQYNNSFFFLILKKFSFYIDTLIDVTKEKILI